jgi:hypothetical protein
MDKSMIADMESLPEADKQRMATMIDQLQIRDRFPKSFTIFTIFKLYFFYLFSIIIMCWIWGYMVIYKLLAAQ